MAFLDLSGLSHFKDKNDALYAKQDGSYELLTSGNADQLVSTVGVEDSAPYTFRTTGGSADVGDRMNLKAVIGGTVAWNQLCPIPSSDKSKTANGVTITDNRDGSYTISTVAGGATAQTYIVAVQVANGVISGHKYLYSGFGVGQSNSNYRLADAQNGFLNYRNKDNSIASASDSGYLDIHIIVASGAVITTPVTVKPWITDLTAMFGSAIADYAYTLESGTAGAGVAWLKKYGWFTKPYYPYNAGSLQSVKTSAHKTIGFNQLSYSPEYLSNSQTLDKSKAVRVIGGASYQFTFDGIGSAANWCIFVKYWYLDGTMQKGGTCPFTVDQGSPTWNANNGWLDGVNNISKARTYSFDYDGYVTFQFWGGGTSSGMVMTNPCFHLRWDGEKDGEYAPFEQHTYALDDVELRGIPKLDANNNLYYDGDEYTPDGTVTRKFGIIAFNGAASENWSYTATLNRVIINLPLALAPASGYVNLNFIADRLVADNTQRDFNAYINDYKNLVIYAPSSITSAADWKTWLSSNPIDLVYELATPTIESADAYTELQICNDFGTEEFVDAATRDFDMPVGHNTVYQPNLRAKLEMTPNSPDGDGDYLVRQTNGVNEYVLFSEVKELPDMPTTDGTYVLKCTVADGTATLSWVSE